MSQDTMHTPIERASSPKSTASSALHHYPHHLLSASLSTHARTPMMATWFSLRSSHQWGFGRGQPSQLIRISICWQTTSLVRAVANPTHFHNSACLPFAACAPLAIAYCGQSRPRPALFQLFRPTLSTSRFHFLDNPMTPPVVSHFSTTSSAISLLSKFSSPLFHSQHTSVISPSPISTSTYFAYLASTSSLLLFKPHSQVSFLFSLAHIAADELCLQCSFLSRCSFSPRHFSALRTFLFVLFFPSQLLSLPSWRALTPIQVSFLLLFFSCTFFIPARHLDTHRRTFFHRDQFS